MSLKEATGKMSSNSEPIKPFISTESFQYHSWAYRSFYDHLLPNVQSVKEESMRANRPTSGAVSNKTPQNYTNTPVHELNTLSDVMSRVRSSRKSSLTRAQHIGYLRLFQKDGKKDLPSKQNNRKANLLRVVAKEQTEFLKKARAQAERYMHLYEHLHPDAERYIKELLKNHFSRVYTYPCYYEPKDAIPLLGANPSVHLKHLATLLEMGCSPRAILPTLKTKTVTPLTYCKVIDQYPIGDEVQLGKKGLHKVPVSADPNAETLAQKHGAVIVISSSSMQRLADNLAPDFKEPWVVPVVVRHSDKYYGGKDCVTVYVDKPLPPKESTAYERNYWFHKFSLKTLLLHPHFKKPVISENAAEERREQMSSAESAADFLECDADSSDLEVFGVESSPSKLFSSPERLEAVDKVNLVADKDSHISESKVFEVKTFPSHPCETIALLQSPSKMEVAGNILQAASNETATQNSEKSVLLENIKEEDKVLECNISSLASDPLHVIKNLSLNSTEDSDSEASNLVIDEPMENSSPQKGVKQTNIEKPSCKYDNSSLFSPKSSCDSDALLIDDGCDSPKFSISSISSPPHSGSVGMEDTITSSTATQKLRGGKRKATSDRRSRVYKKPRNPNKAVKITGSETGKQTTRSSKLDVNENAVKLPEPRGMVTRSKSRQMSEVLSSQVTMGMSTRQRARKQVPEKLSEKPEEKNLLKKQAAKTISKIEDSKPLPNTQDLNDESEEEIHHQARELLPSTPTSPDSELRPSSKNLLLEVFGASSSDEEMTSPKSESSTKTAKCDYRKISVDASKTKKPVQMKEKSVSEGMDTNPLTRILADQEKLLRTTGNVKVGGLPLIGSVETKLGASESDAKVAYSRENANDYKPFAGDKHVAYNLFSLGGIRLLVRSSVHGQTETIPKRRIIGERYTILPKLEYQCNCGGEMLSPSEEVRHAVSMLVRPGSKIVQARIDAYSSEVLAVDIRGVECYSTSAQAAVNLIYTILQKLLFLPAGYYLLTHNKNEGFANILKQTDEPKKNAFDLHGGYSYNLTEQPSPMTICPWLPIDPNVFFKHHQRQIPATFEPCPPNGKRANKKKGKGVKKSQNLAR